MKASPRKRSLRPGLCRLEDRRLLSGLSAVWIGQDGHDYVGPYSEERPDGVQDIRISLSGLPEDRVITTAELNGYGGSQWLYNGRHGPWRAALVREPGASTADLFVEPDRVETGREFHLALTFDDGERVGIYFQGGQADPNLRMPEATMAVQWIGQDGHDLTGPDLNVGPDGFQDVRLSLTQLATEVAVSKVLVNGADGASWQYGLNPQGEANAELVRDPRDPSRADLFLSPDRDLQGQTLTVQVVYATGRTDTAQIQAGATDPGLRMPSPTPPTLRSGVSAQWLGQDAPLPEGSGLVRLAVSGLPDGRSVLGAVLSGATHHSWAYRSNEATEFPWYRDPYAGRLTFQADGQGGAILSFPPVRDESGSRLTLRLQFDDGSIGVATLEGGASDPAWLAPGPSDSVVQAHPGDDLNDLANRFGTVLLAPGEYHLSEPLVLSQPVTIQGLEAGATLIFRQGDDQPTWTSAIKIHAGNTTLDGFAVRFDGPVRWRNDVNFGPAVIGTTDNLDREGQSNLKAEIRLTRLDLESPPPLSPGELAPRLIRVVSATDGRIEDNTLRGGTTEFFHGPWTIQRNLYLGTVAGTWTWDVFSGHNTNDLVLRENVISPVEDAGRTWRFLVLTGIGDGDLIEGNTVRGIGARDGDTVSVNAPEILLTESYRLRFEGKPSAIAEGGQILQIPNPQGEPAVTGDIVSILDGPHAGTWYRIAQAISPTTYLMDDPLPLGDYAISIGNGFVNQVYRGNTIDMRGSTIADGMVLVGNHFGTQVVDNHVLGGRVGIRFTSFATEQPGIWGWSHTPVFDATIMGNTIEDAQTGLIVRVDHGPPIKSNRGRLYLAAEVLENQVVWSDAFASRRSEAVGIQLGHPGSIDPGELALSFSGNLADVPVWGSAPIVRMDAANFNGSEQHDQRFALPILAPGLPETLELVLDTGASASDRITQIGRLRVGGADRAVAFEYRVGSDGPFLRVDNPDDFLPEGLVEGVNTIYVRAIDARDRRGPEHSLTITLDTQAPEASPPTLSPESDTGRSQQDRITRATRLVFQATGDSSDRVILLRGGQPVADGRAGLLVDPGPVPDGSHEYAIRRIDLAGNISESSTITVVVDTQAPGRVSGLVVSADGLVSFEPTSTEDEYLYRIGQGPLHPIGSSLSFRPEGLGPDSNALQVFAVDPAGNVGPSATVAVNARPTIPSGVWIGQDGHDFVGPSLVEEPDGMQDMRIAISGLRTDQPVVFVDVQGYGGSRWQYGAPWGHWRAAFFQAEGSASGDIYLQPDRIETGRSFQIVVGYPDGTSEKFWVDGGVADPKLRMPEPRKVEPRAVESSEEASPATTGPRFAPTPIGLGRLAFASLIERRRQNLLQSREARQSPFAWRQAPAMAMARILNRRQFSRPGKAPAIGPGRQGM